MKQMLIKKDPNTWTIQKNAYLLWHRQHNANFQGYPLLQATTLQQQWNNASSHSRFRFLLTKKPKTARSWSFEKVQSMWMWTVNPILVNSLHGSLHSNCSQVRWHSVLFTKDSPVKFCSRFPCCCATPLASQSSSSLIVATTDSACPWGWLANRMPSPPTLPTSFPSACSHFVSVISEREHSSPQACFVRLIMPFSAGFSEKVRQLATLLLRTSMARRGWLRALRSLADSLSTRITSSSSRESRHLRREVSEGRRSPQFTAGLSSSTGVDKSLIWWISRSLASLKLVCLRASVAAEICKLLSWDVSSAQGGEMSQTQLHLFVTCT